jgi:hypothetical protein
MIPRHRTARDALVPVALGVCAAILAACASSGGSGPLAGMTGGQVASQALADLKSASSVHVAGTISESGQSISLNLNIAKGSGCTGTIGASGKGAPFAGTLQVAYNGKNLYMKPSQTFWKSMGMTSQEDAQLAGKWVNATQDAALSSFSGFCTTAGLVSTFNSSTDLSTFARGTGPAIAGQPTVDVYSAKGGHLYISGTAHPEIARIAGQSGTTGGTLNFTGYGTSPTAPLPAANMIVSDSLPGS